MFLLLVIDFVFKNRISEFAVEFVMIALYGSLLNLFFWSGWKFTKSLVPQYPKHPVVTRLIATAEELGTPCWGLTGNYEGQTGRCPTSPGWWPWWCVCGASCRAACCACEYVVPGLMSAACLMHTCPSGTRWIFLASSSSTYEKLDVLSD